MLFKRDTSYIRPHSNWNHKRSATRLGDNSRGYDKERQQLFH